MRGFSLVELSIVLVILGLLTGGILAGQSLVRAAQLRSISGDVMRYYTAIHSFRDKYFAFPGDMNNATQFWGVQTDDTACKTEAGVGTATCDGNGNGIIGWTDGASPLWHESFNMWRHLALAGLIEGNFAGVPVAIANCNPGRNVPASRLGKAFFLVSSSNNNDSSYHFATPQQYNRMFFGARNTSCSIPADPVLKPEEAWNIDSKMDDGIPATGSVWGARTASCLTSTTDAATARYLLSSDNIACSLTFAYR